MQLFSVDRLLIPYNAKHRYFLSHDLLCFCRTPKAKVKTDGKNPITPSNKPAAVKNSAIKKEKSHKPVAKKPDDSDDSDDEPLVGGKNKDFATIREQL